MSSAPSSGGKSGGGGGNVPYDEMVIPEECLALRYYHREINPAVVKTSLSKIKNVTKVEVDEKQRLILVTWKGKCKGIAQLESLAAASGVPAHLMNHTHVYAALKTGRGSNLDTLRSGINELSGVRGCQVVGGQLEIHCDLQDLSMDAIRKVAKAAHIELHFTSHLWFEPAITGGDLEKMQSELLAVQGIVVARVKDEQLLGVWAIKATKDEQVKAAVEKAGATCTAVAKP